MLAFVGVVGEIDGLQVRARFDGGDAQDNNNSRLLLSDDVVFLVLAPCFLLREAAVLGFSGDLRAIGIAMGWWCAIAYVHVVGAGPLGIMISRLKLVRRRPGLSEEAWQ